MFGFRIKLCINFLMTGLEIVPYTLFVFRFFQFNFPMCIGYV